MKRLLTRKIVIHCSATKPSQDIGAAEIREWHLSKGWSDIGYHFVIRRSGQVELGRPLEDVGAHVAGHNSDSVGICLVGGLDSAGRAVDEADFTEEQLESATMLVNTLRLIYPGVEVLGHRDLSPDTNKDGKIDRWEWVKTCPGLEAKEVFV